MTATKTKPYRIARTSGGRAEIYRLMPDHYDTLEAAEAAQERLARRAGRYGNGFYILAPGEVREAVLDLKAKTLGGFLKGHGAQVACDFDDARDRLLKLADVADKRLAMDPNATPPRKGWLKTETGLRLMYDALTCLAERRRVSGSNLTPEEMARTTSRDSYRLREVLSQEFLADFDAKMREAAEASTHKDEY